MTVRAQIDVSVLAEHLKQRAPVCENPIRAVKYIFSDGAEIWTPCARTTTELPGGVNTKGLLAEPPDRWSVSLQPSNNKTTIADAKLKILDKDSEFTLAIQAKKQAGVGTRKAVVRLYESCIGEAYTDDHVIGTYQLFSDNYQAGYIHQTLKPITYSTKERIFETYTLYIRKSYSVDQMNLTVVDLYEDKDEFGAPANLNNKVRTFAHNSEYESHDYYGDEGTEVNPSTPYLTSDTARNHTHEEFGYLQLATGEIVVFTGIANAGFDDENRAQYTVFLVERGALGTTPSAVTVDGDISKTENLPKAQELVYLEEKGPELISLILTGQSINGKRQFPFQWSLNIDRSWLDISTLAWMNEFPLPKHIVRTTKSVDGKDWLESEILPIMGAFLNNLPDGRIQAKPLVLPLEDSPTSIEFNHYNCEHVKAGFSFTRKLDEIHSHIITRWGYREVGDYFLYESNDYYEESKALYKGTETLVREFKTLQPGEHTDASVSTIGQRLAMANAFERVVMKVRALPSMRYVELGDVVRVNFDRVRDMSSDRPNDVALDRAMLVTGVDPDKNTRQVTYTLEGYTRKPDPKYSEGTDGENPTVTIDDISEGRTDLRTVMTIDGSGNVTGAGTPIPVGEYYFDGPTLTFQNTTPFTAAGFGRKMGIYCPTTTHVQDNSDSGMFSLLVKGTHRGGAGATSTTPAEPGESGFFGTGPGGGGANAWVQSSNLGSSENPNYQETLRHVTSVDNGAVTTGRNGNVSGMALSRQNGKIIGLPLDLSGSGGAGGGLTTITGVPDSQTGAKSTLYIDGSTGGRGGMGFELLCGSFDWKEGNKLNLRGGGGIVANKLHNMYGARGGDGYPGVFHLILPRNATPPPIHEYVSAVHGQLEANMSGERLGYGTVKKTLNAPDYRPAVDPPAAKDMANACSVVSYVPPDSVPELVNNAFIGREWQADFDTLKYDMESLFSTTMRSGINYEFTATEPSNPTAGDYWGDISDLNPEGRPAGYQYFTGTGWESVPLQDSVWTMLVDTWLAMTDAQRAQAAADGKNKIFRVDSASPADWPTPSGYGDLLYVDPLSQVFQAINHDGVLIWDQDESFVDELAVLSAGNILIDGGFGMSASRNKYTWETDPDKVIWTDQSESGTNWSSTFSAWLQTAVGYGENGSAGYRIILQNPGTDYNATSQRMYIPATKKHQAKLGDIFYAQMRAQRPIYANTDSFSAMGVAIRGFDRDGVDLGIIGEKVYTDPLIYTTFSGYIDVESLSKDWSDVQEIRAEIMVTPPYNPGKELDYNIDFVSLERANYFNEPSYQSDSTGSMSPADKQYTLSGFKVFNEYEEVHISYNVHLMGASVGDTADVYIGIEDSVQNETELLVEHQKSLSTDWLNVSGTRVIKGLARGQYLCGFKLDGDSGSQFTNRYLSVRVERNPI